MYLLRKFLITTLIIFAGAGHALAGVVIGGTRVIYDGEKKETSLSVRNPDAVPYLIQSWIDMPDNTTARAPFIITPPLYRLDQGQQNTMRIVSAGKIAENKESLYWLNIKSIPASEKKENTLQIAVKTRIKLIYRPSALKDHTPEEFADNLKWSRYGNQIKVSNSGAYYMNFSEIKIGEKRIPDVTYVAPGSTTTFVLPGNSVGNTISFKLINDYGSVGKEHHSSL